MIESCYSMKTRSTKGRACPWGSSTSAAPSSPLAPRGEPASRAHQMTTAAPGPMAPRGELAHGARQPIGATPGLVAPREAGSEEVQRGAPSVTHEPSPNRARRNEGGPSEVVAEPSCKKRKHKKRVRRVDSLSPPVGDIHAEEIEAKEGENESDDAPLIVHESP